MIIHGSDPYRGPSVSLGNRLRRALWQLVYVLLFRPSPRPLHAWRSLLLRLFGARIGSGCHVYPSVRIWAPWNLVLSDHVGIADRTNLYTMATISIGSHAVVSEGAFLCCGSHDYQSSNFQLVAKPISVGARAWICAEAFLHPGVDVPEGCVVGARAVVTKSLPEAWTVYAGNPCRVVGRRPPQPEKAP